MYWSMFTDTGAKPRLTALILALALQFDTGFINPNITDAELSMNWSKARLDRASYRPQSCLKPIAFTHHRISPPFLPIDRPSAMHGKEKLMKVPFLSWIDKLEVEVQDQRCSELVQLQYGDVATGAGIVARSELKA